MPEEIIVVDYRVIASLNDTSGTQAKSYNGLKTLPVVSPYDENIAPKAQPSKVTDRDQFRSIKFRKTKLIKKQCLKEHDIRELKF